MRGVRRHMSSPYDAPTSDLVEATPTSVMPGCVRLALWLYIGSFAITAIFSWFDPTPPEVPPYARPMVALVEMFYLVLLVGPLVFIFYKVFKRRNWARMVWATFNLVATFLYVPF